METNKLHGYLVILAGAVLAIIGLFTMIDSGYSACGMEFRPDLIQLQLETERDILKWVLKQEIEKE